MYPADYKYTADHLWISMQGPQATVGITDHAAKTLCPLVSVQLPEIGRSFARQQTFGALESVKALTEMIAPLRGKVVAVNTDLAAHPERLCEDPKGTWIAKFELTDAAEPLKLLSNEQYASLVTSPPKPKSPPNKPPQKKVKLQPPPKPQPQSGAVKAPESMEREERLALSWSTRLGNTRLRGGDEAFGDRDYSGGSYFSWRERDIVLSQDHRFIWQDSSFTRVSSGGLSSTIPSRKQYRGIWKITVVAGLPRLVLEDNERGVVTFRLEEGGRNGRLLLDSKPYAWSRL